MALECIPMNGSARCLSSNIPVLKSTNLDSRGESMP